MKLFLYTQPAKLTDSERRRLVKAGYLPIHVEDHNAVKVIEPLPDLTGQQLDVITRAAIEAIRTQRINYDARTAFADALVKMLSEQPAAQKAKE